MKGVVIKAKPDVQSMFFNAGVVVRVHIATTGAFTTDPPTHLVDRNLVLVMAGIAGVGQLIDRGQCSDATSQNGNPPANVNARATLPSRTR